MAWGETNIVIRKKIPHQEKNRGSLIQNGFVWDEIGRIGEQKGQGEAGQAMIVPWMLTRAHCRLFPTLKH